MTERLPQYIWQFQYFNRANLTTVAGEKIEIHFPGTLNTNAGPDFSAAKIKIGNTLLIGSVEIHITTSEWDKHGHSDDKNYDNVILHVVYQNDKAANATALPLLELEPHISAILLDKYTELMNTGETIPCAKHIPGVKAITWLAWKERLLAERLTRKANSIFSSLEQNKYHWEESFWWLLARNFGLKVNQDAFEAIARSIPVNLLAKHKSSIHQLEALLLGQADLLNESFTEEYPLLLQREYRFLKGKYNLLPASIPVQFLRMRPGNFPTVRLAQLAQLIHTSSHLFSKMLEAAGVKDIREWLNVTANDFWHYHYTLKEASAFKRKTLGAAMADNIIINTVVPVLFAYGSYHKKEDLKTKAIQWLEAIPGEDNTIISGFKSIAVESRSAYDSQALIELKNEYCNNKKCLTCAVGNLLLKRSG